jgi:hypothetical protein
MQPVTKKREKREIAKIVFFMASSCVSRQYMTTDVDLYFMVFLAAGRLL